VTTYDKLEGSETKEKEILGQFLFI